MSTPQKIALVTGAGSGIGRACAHALLQAGFTVVLAGRRREPLEATLRDSGRPESEGLVVPADVADPASVGALFDQIRARFGRLDLLFNNAGVNVPNVAVDDLSFEQWRHVIDINLTGAFLCAQAAFRLMKSQTPRGGRIINNGSVSAQAPRPDSVAYTTAKHGITGLTKSLSLDGRRFDIACGQIDIGNTDTPLAGRMKTGVPQADGTIAIEPTFDVSHVARAVVYMASLPLEANVSTITVMATKMPLVGRG